MAGTDLQIPFSGIAADRLKDISANLSGDQALWLSGYFYGLHAAKLLPADAGAPASSDAVSVLPVTVLYGSQTGNSKSVAYKVAEKIKERGLQFKVIDMNDYSAKDLKNEKNLLIVVSTQGEGDPPVSAEEFREFIIGARAPKFSELQYSVLALGDKSYLNFCQTGREFDERLEALGGKRIVDRVDCDVDFQEDADRWIAGVMDKLSLSAGTNGAVFAQKSGFTPNGSTVAAPSSPLVVHDRKRPFEAPILEKIQLNGKGSFKETYHIELSLENSGLRYEPGDSLGILPSNPERLVYEALHHSKLDASTVIQQQTLFESLAHHYELTVITKDVLQKHNEYAQSAALSAMLPDQAKLKEYFYGRDIVDMLKDFPFQHTAETFLNTLRKLPPRVYSIASSLTAYPDEAHLTVAAVRYTAGRYKEGAASTHLADRLKKEDFAKVFIERNEFFKLPAGHDVPILMIGPGTGIAPFRAFVQEREARGAKGKNWLFFGNPHFATDFLYQTEWLQYLKKGVLNHLDVAFSRDTPEKVYVQHKLQKRAREVYDWLESGAYIYVCGDKGRMASDVQKVLTSIVEQTAQISPEKAQEYVKNLKKQRRYLEDVY